MSSKDLVIMIHGFTSNKNQFRKIKKELEEKGKEVICVQLNSHNDEEDNQEFDIEKSIEEVRALMKQNEKREKILVGESIGAIISINIALENKVKKMILLSTPLLGVRENSIKERLEEKNIMLEKFGKTKKEIKKEKINKIKRDFDAEAFKANKGIKKIEAECLIMYGEKDEKEYKESAHIILSGIGSERKRVIAMKESGHSMILGVEKEEVLRIIKEEIMEV